MQLIPTKCMVKDDPDSGLYGDCLRACVACILNLPSADVPHFYHDGCDGLTGTQRLRDWLKTRNLTAVWFAYDGSYSRDELLSAWADMNPDAPTILMGGTGTGNHAVVIIGSKVVNNPAWYGGRIIEPGSNTFWNLIVIGVGA